MLKKLRDCDIDDIMELWKSEVVKTENLLKNKSIKDIYTNVRSKFINNLSSTIIYTEDDNIEGFISVDQNNEIWSIVVKSNIRREGIGTILLENCKKEYKKLTTKVSSKNQMALMFFNKCGFKKFEEITKEKETEYILEWNKEEKSKVTLIYFDEDLDKNLLSNKSNIVFKCINIKQFIKDENISKEDINNIKTYIKLRKILEDAMNSEIILLYINYNNYYNYIDEQIKEIVKIKKINLKIIVCEPFSIEGSKKNSYIKAIEQSYKDYEIIKIDCSLDIKEDINLNQIFYKRNEIILQKIETIAENM